MKHLAIIADGNRRWAEQRSLPKQAGYVQGLTTIENCCDWAIKQNISFLSFFCFSTENWKRKKEEVEMLMDLARQYFIEQKSWYINKGIKVSFLGRKDHLPADLIKSCIELEKATSENTKLTLNICINYGGRDEIIQAITQGMKTEEEITSFLTRNSPEPDLILRTGGQQRLSNFFLWQAAYSELLFLDLFFPDLNHKILDEAYHEYASRKRNYGA